MTFIATLTKNWVDQNKYDKIQTGYGELNHDIVAFLKCNIISVCLNVNRKISVGIEIRFHFKWSKNVRYIFKPIGMSIHFNGDFAYNSVLVLNGKFTVYFHVHDGNSKTLSKCTKGADVKLEIYSKFPSHKFSSK